jgi:hypothetical protein
MIFSIMIAASPTGIIGDLGNELVKQLLTIQKELLISPLFQGLNDLGVYLACFFVFFYSLPAKRAKKMIEWEKYM